MKINESIILNMVTPHVAAGVLSYDTFDRLFRMLPHAEQYKVADFLSAQGIELVDADDEEAGACDGGFSVDNSVFGGNDPRAFADLAKKGDHRMNELLARAAQAGNRDAMDQLFSDNRNLVWKVVRRYTGLCRNSLSEEDLFQAGSLGMMRAVELFNYDLGWKFSTYAECWIRQAITREISNYGYTIRIPVHRQEQIRKVNRVYNDLHPNGVPSPDGIAKAAAKLGMSESAVLECLQLREYVMGCTSLDTPIGEDGEAVLSDFIAADEKSNPEEMLDQICMKSDLMNALHTLTPREEQILIARYGLDGMGPRTLDEIGKAMHVTRERIRQIEAKALRKLRHPSRSCRLKDWLAAA